MTGGPFCLFRVAERRPHALDVVSLSLQPTDEPLPVFRPGQFALLSMPGAAPIPTAISGRLDPGGLQFTIRAVDEASAALCKAGTGTVIGVRGPFGAGWQLPAPIDADLVMVAVDLGLAPLRPLIHHVLADRRRYRRVSLFIGARMRHDLLFTEEYRTWMDGRIAVLVTVDQRRTGAAGWVANVPALFDHADCRPHETTGYVCGPPLLLRSAARRLVEHGVPPDRIWLSPAQTRRSGVDPIARCDLTADLRPAAVS
jgi:anaerobic sulfite reductase subunit B